MNKLDIRLLILYILTLLIAAGCYVYFEFLSPVKESPLASTPNFGDIKYLTEVVTDILAIAFVYLSTRMMRMKKVMQSVAADNANYAKWAYLRWGMLAVIIFLGEGVYYFMHSPATVGVPIIGALAMFFVWPTASRRQNEIQASVDFQNQKA